MGVGCILADPTPAGVGIGAALIGVGAGLHCLSKAYLEQNRRLTTAGPYRWVRNPFYLANGLIDLGLVFTIGRVWLGLLYATLFWLAYRRTIEDEEAHLSSLFGAEYRCYARRVPRFFPTRTPLPRDEACGRFDLANPSLRSGQEYARLLGILLAPAAVLGAFVLRREGLQIFEERNSLLLGSLLLLPVGWVLKLGLAETFRAPEVPLLWGSPRGLSRIALVSCSFLPLGLAGLMGDGSGHSFTGVGGLVVVVGAAIWGRRHRARAAGYFGASIAAAGLAIHVGEFGLAAPPVLVCGWAGLDALGAARCASLGRPRSGRIWRYAGNIAVGGFAGFVCIAAARFVAAG